MYLSRSRNRRMFRSGARYSRAANVRVFRLRGGVRL